MKLIAFSALMTLACVSLFGGGQKFPEEQILQVLQQKVELLDPDASFYYSDKERQMVTEFLEKNKPLFESLKEREVFYYIQLVDLNRNPNVTGSLARHAYESFIKYRSDYAREEKIQLEKAMSRFRSLGLLPPTASPGQPKHGEDQRAKE